MRDNQDRKGSTSIRTLAVIAAAIILAIAAARQRPYGRSLAPMALPGEYVVAVWDDPSDPGDPLATVIKGKRDTDRIDRLMPRVGAMR